MPLPGARERKSWSFFQCQAGRMQWTCSRLLYTLGNRHTAIAASRGARAFDRLAPACCLATCSMSGRCASRLLTLAQKSLRPSMSAAILPHCGSLRHLPFSSAALRRNSQGHQLGNALCGRQAGPLVTPQRQVARRLAAAAASSAATAAEAAPPSLERKELPKNFDPAASEESLYQW